MANLNQTSKYIGALVDFINDTKPFHTKLTEVVEEYQFYDTMSVKLSERFSTRITDKPTWMYSFYSGGAGGLEMMNLKQLHHSLKSIFPLNTISSTLGLNTDLANVPYVYSKKAFDGIGAADLYIKTSGSSTQTIPMVEGIDYFLSHGSFQFKIKQTTNANGDFVPLWSEVRDASIISTASNEVRRLENDSTRSAAAITKIRTYLQSLMNRSDVSTTAKSYVSAHLTPLTTFIASYTAALSAVKTAAAGDGITYTPSSITGYALVVYLQERFDLLSVSTKALLATVVNLLDTVVLSQDYEVLLTQLQTDGTAVPSGYAGWIGNTTTGTYVSELFSSWSPPMYFYLLGNDETYESGKSTFSNTANSYLSISGISTNSTTELGDCWDIKCEDATYPLYGVYSSINGFIGAFTATTAGTAFSHSTVSFTGTYIAQAPLGEVLKIRNDNRVVFSPTAPLETWDIIKVNPISYSRPEFISTRYGWIESGTGVRGVVDLLLQSLSTGTIVLTATSSTTFAVTSTVDPSYTGTATVGVLYNDSKIQFRIRAGSAYSYVVGDRYFIHIKNDPASAKNFDVSFGFDLDPFDWQALTYNSPNASTQLNFVFDGRITDIYQSSLGLTIGQTIPEGTSVRIVAIPDLSSPIRALDANANEAPFSSSSAVLKLYYATTFDVRVSTDAFATSTSLGTATVGTLFSAGDMSFTVVQGSRPFIGVVSVVDGVTGGDVIHFEVNNSQVRIDDLPVHLLSSNFPRISMHGDGFHEAPAAVWTLSFTSSTEYTFSAIPTTSAVTIPTVTGRISTAGATANEGTAINVNGVNFTILSGSGFAAGDKFTFTTYETKPTYLVHGSVSGWMDEAVVGVPYWNGIIGFEIQAPTARVFLRDNTRPTALSWNNTSMSHVGSSWNTWNIGTLGTTLTIDAINSAMIPAGTYTLFVNTAGTGWNVYFQSPTALSASSIGSLLKTNVGASNAANLFSCSMYFNNNQAQPTDLKKIVIVVSSDVDTLCSNSGNTWSFDSSSISVDRLRFDAPTLQYLLTPTPVGSATPTGWHIARSDIGAIGHLDLSGSFADEYITLSSSTIATDSVPLVVEITGDDFALWNAQDVVILRPITDARYPAAGDQVVVDKRTNDRIGVNLNYDYITTSIPDISKLAPETIDSRFIDTTTATNAPLLSATSPETAVLRNWIPLVMKPKDSSTSVAEFSNSGTIFELYSTGTGNLIGTLAPTGTNTLWPVTFTWDHDFFTEFLPMNTESSIVTFGSGFNDLVNVRMSETIRMIETSGALSTDYMFRDDIIVALTETPTIQITMSEADSFNATINDGPFSGEFLAGYGNLAFDSETTNGSFDAGVPLVSWYHEARQLAGLEEMNARQLTMTAAEVESRLNVLKLLLNNFIQPAGLSTDLPTFLAALDADPTASLTSTDFGIPTVGMAMDIAVGAKTADTSNSGTEGASTSMSEAVVLFSNEYDNTGTIILERRAIFKVASLPVPSVLPTITTYAAFETPLVIESPMVANVFEISIDITPSNASAIDSIPTPRIYIWLPSWGAPVQATVTKIDAGRYEVSVGSATEAKIYVLPGV